MKKLPNVRTTPPADWQRERLERWLQEWQVDRALAETPEDQDQPGHRRVGQTQVDAMDRSRWSTRYSVRSPVSATDRAEPVAPGQIRLFQPASEITRQRLLYFAVLQPETAGSLLVAPFGRFAEPATPGEWLTGRDHPGWRVLCLWNARVLPADRLRQSWLIDHLGDAERQRALALWRHQTSRTELPAAMAREVGPPVVHPLDPRWQYLEEEKTALDLLGTVTSPPPDGFGEAAPAELALAAESRAVYGASARFQVADSSLILKASATSDPTRCQVTVIDATGRVSLQLDSHVLRAADGTLSEPIVQGQTVILRSMLAPGLVLRAPDSTARRLRPLP